jgi:hypothetical protein
MACFVTMANLFEQFEHLSRRRVRGFRTVSQPSWSLKPIGVWSSQGQWEKMESISNEADGSIMYPWKCVMHVPMSEVHYYPWSKRPSSVLLTAKRGLICVDMGDQGQLDGFIERYLAQGKAKDVDWSKVAADFAGVVFRNVDTLPDHAWRRYNEPDGCWVNSLTVDSACVWAPKNIIKGHRWVKRVENAFL